MERDRVGRSQSGRLDEKHNTLGAYDHQSLMGSQDRAGDKSRVLEHLQSTLTRGSHALVKSEDMRVNDGSTKIDSRENEQAMPIPIHVIPL